MIYKPYPGTKASACRICGLSKGTHNSQTKACKPREYWLPCLG